MNKEIKSSTLAAKKCKPCAAGSPALQQAQIDSLLAQLDGWTGFAFFCGQS